MDLLEQHFELALEIPDGIKKLRELILKLAMQGKLVPQIKKEGLAVFLLQEIQLEKQSLINKKNLKSKNKTSQIKQEEIPYILPSTWVWCRLDEISEYIQRGKGPKYSIIKEIPVISQKCVQWTGFNKDVVKFIEPNTLGK